MSMSKKGLFIVLGLCFSLFMVHAQTELYPGMVFVDRVGFTWYVDDVSGGVYLLPSGELHAPNVSYTYIKLTSVTRGRDGRIVLRNRMILPAPIVATIELFTDLSVASDEVYTTKWAEDVPAESYRYEYVNMLMDKQTYHNLTITDYVYYGMFEWKHDTIMIWDESGNMVYDGLVDNAEPSSAE